MVNFAPHCLLVICLSAFATEALDVCLYRRDGIRGRELKNGKKGSGIAGLQATGKKNGKKRERTAEIVGCGEIVTVARTGKKNGKKGGQMIGSQGFAQATGKKNGKKGGGQMIGSQGFTQATGKKNGNRGQMIGSQGFTQATGKKNGKKARLFQVDCAPEAPEQSCLEYFSCLELGIPDSLSIVSCNELIPDEGCVEPTPRPTPRPTRPPVRRSCSVYFACTRVGIAVFRSTDQDFVESCDAFLPAVGCDEPTPAPTPRPTVEPTVVERVASFSFSYTGEAEGHGHEGNFQH